MAIQDRLSKLRKMAQERSYDAVILRNNADLRWLTGAERVFDSEQAHSAFITADKASLHTDTRYYNSFIERMGEQDLWSFNQDPLSHCSWLIAQAKAAKAQTIALEDSISVAFYEALKRAAEDQSLHLNFVFLHSDLVKMRAVKDAQEIEIMKQAQAITDAAFEHMCGFIQVGMTEKEVQAELEHYMLQKGADGLAFGSIVAAGPNAANPHAVPGSYKLKKGELLLMDYGAAYRDYCSDMTRVVALGEPSAQMREIYDIVREVNEACSRAIKPGIKGEEVHKLACKMIEDAGYGDKFGHGLGHGVGIEIHELPNLGGSSQLVLEPGNVVTNEPGIYLPGVGGVRLEDFGVVSQEGFDIFTQSTHDLRIL